MNSFLKIVAVLCMLIDHIGYIFFPRLIFLRIIGRISFPIFAFLLTEGYKHSKDLRKYFLRLFAFAIISIYPFSLISSQMNIFFTLSYSLLVLCAWDRSKTLAILLILLSHFLKIMDYGMYGVLTVFCFYVFKEKVFLLVLSQLFLSTVFFNLYFGPGIQVFCLLSLPFIFNKDAVQLKLGKLPKLFFYAFYPLHILVLYFLQIFCRA